MDEPGGGRILIVDDEPGNVRVLSRLMRREGYEVCSAANGELALAAVAAAPPDVVLMDVNMPVMDGIDACRRLKLDPATRLLPVILITGLTDVDGRLRGIDAGADDFLAKPYVVDELRARVRSLRRLKRYTDDLESAESVILSLALTIEARDPCTRGHCARLARYGVALGARLGLDDDQRLALHRGGYLHDVGKVGVPDSVLLKPGRLTDDEMRQMRQHPLIGDTLCGEMRSLHAVRLIVRHHHERLDGSGYPDALSGAAIPILAQIISVVDTYDAITTARPYKPACAPEVAFHELRQEAVRGWKQGELVEAFIALQSEPIMVSA